MLVRVAVTSPTPGPRRGSASRTLHRGVTSSVRTASRAGPEGGQLTVLVDGKPAGTSGACDRALTGWPARSYAAPRPTRSRRAPSAPTSRPPATPRCSSRPTGARSQLLDYRQLYNAVGAPAVGDAGHRLHAGPHRLARAHRPDEERFQRMYGLSLVLHRRAAGRRRARADDARRARRGHAHLPVHADRRRGAPRRVLRPLLQRGRRARGGQPRGPAGGDERAPQPRVRRALRRDAAARGSTGWRASPRTSRRWSRR